MEFKCWLSEADALYTREDAGPHYFVIDKRQVFGVGLIVGRGKDGGYLETPSMSLPEIANKVRFGSLAETPAGRKAASN